MSALPGPKIGIGSGINDSTRNLGSVLGVAIIGSIATSAYTHALGGAAAGHTMGQAVALAHHGGPARQAIFASAARAFIHGADLGILAGAAATALATALALRYLPPAAASAAPRPAEARATESIRPAADPRFVSHARS